MTFFYFIQTVHHINMPHMERCMKTCLSIIDSYDEIMDFIFPPNLSFFMMNFELELGTCFFHS
jgi:hypothetical protein